MAHYLDTSALVKLVVAEPETRAFRAWLRRAEREPITSELARTELLRATRRVAPDRVVRAREVLDGVGLLRVDTEILESAARLDPTSLRSLDAVHLASALALGDDLSAMVTYDDRLAAAGLAYGVRLMQPGRSS